MTAPMNQIQGGKWDEFMRRLFPVKDRSIAPVMGSELNPMVMVQEWEPELYALRGERLYAATEIASAGGAATFNLMQIDNPTGSGTIVIIEGFSMVDTSGVRSFQTFVTPPVAIAGLGDPVARDSRFDTRRPTGIVGLNAGALVTVTRRTGTYLVGTSDSLLITTPHVITPGFAFVIQDGTQNQADRITVWWRERGADTSELNVG